MKVFEHKDEYSTSLRIFSYGPKVQNLWVSVEDRTGNLAFNVCLPVQQAEKLIEALNKLLHQDK